jgi:hypothetical protein
MLRSFLLLLMLNVTLGLSQTTFQKYYGGAQEEYGYSFQETSDGGFVVCGRTFSFGTGGWEGYILRLDQAGDTLWTRTYGNIQYDEVQDIDTTSDGGYILTGHTWTNDWAGDVYLIKLDAMGNVTWDQTYGGTVGLSDKGYSVRETSDGGYVVCGSTETYGQGGDDVYVIKTNSTGALVWTRTVGTTGAIEVGREIQQTSDGGYVITGYTDGAGTSFHDIFLIKLNASGTVLWNYRYGGSSYDFAYTVEETSDGGFILGATTNSFGAGDWDAYLLKTDSLGTLQWSKTYGLSGEDRAQAARQTSDGGYIICGRSNSVGSGGYDATLHKTDASGNLSWTKSYGGTLEDQAWFVREYSGGGYVVCGYSYSYGSGSKDLVMIRTDVNGASGCNESSASFSTSTPSTITNTIGISSSGGIASAVPTAMRNTNTVVSVECEGVSCSVVADFTASDTTICEGSTISFTNSSTAATTYLWLQDGVSFGSTADIAQTFNTAGGFQVSMIASDGSCSDTAETSITVVATSSSTDTQSGCDEFLWIDGILYTSSNNTATHTLTNAAGCDSLVTLDLTITTIDSSVTQTGTTFTTNLSGASYQWLNCNNGFAILPGESNQAFTATANGNYAVEITLNGCVDTSDCYSISNVGILENHIGNALNVYPNPTNGNISMDMGAPYSSVDLKVLNIAGQLVSSGEFSNSEKIDLKIEGPAGCYYVHVMTSDNRKAVIKVLLE